MDKWQALGIGIGIGLGGILLKFLESDKPLDFGGRATPSYMSDDERIAWHENELRRIRKRKADSNEDLEAIYNQLIAINERLDEVHGNDRND